LAVTILETATTWEQDGGARGAGQESIGAVDDTCLERLVLLVLDRTPGDVVLEATADARRSATWQALVAQRLDAWQAQVRYGVSARAQALIPRADKGLECLSLPDVFPLVHDMVQSDALAVGQRLQQARQEFQPAEDRLRKHPEGDARGEAYREAPPQVAGHHAEGTYGAARPQASRQQLDTLSRTLPPVALDEAAPQTAAQVEARWHAHGEAIAACAHAAQLPERPAAMTQGKKPWPAGATLVDCWWQGVRQDCAHAAGSPPWQPWAPEVLLPRRSWAHQVTRTRCARRKAKMQRVVERGRAECDAPVFPRSLPPPALADWHTWATQHVAALQRASSAVEGRNGALAPLHHHQRGGPKRRSKVWTVLHNCECRAPDGTTPAARFFRREFPDLFATVVSNINVLPRPRKRHQAVAPNSLMS
jgi:Family of unknown function (DUF6399)